MSITLPRGFGRRRTRSSSRWPRRLRLGSTDAELGSDAPPTRRARTPRPSASSSSARRTTSATTRPSTRAARSLPRRYPDLEILTAENVPEDDNAATIMEQMIDKGAKIIFATSYGHLDAALKVAEEHPDVVVVQQGNIISRATSRRTPAPTSAPSTSRCTWPASRRVPRPRPTSSATSTRSRSRRRSPTSTPSSSAPRAVQPGRRDHHRQHLVLVRPGQAAGRGRAACCRQGVDVITQHQDCTATVIQAAEEAGAMTVGYHADASELAPEGWLTGAVWDWGAALHRHRRDGRSTASSSAASTTTTSGSATRPAPTRSS